MELANSNRAEVTNGVSVLLRLTFRLTLGDKLSWQAQRLMLEAKVERGLQRPHGRFHCAAMTEAFFCLCSMKMRYTRCVVVLRVRIVKIPVCVRPEGIHVQNKAYSAFARINY